MVLNMNSLDEEQYNNRHPTTGEDSSAQQRWNFLDLFRQRNKSPETTLLHVQKQPKEGKRRRGNQRHCRHSSMPETLAVKRAAAVAATATLENRQQEEQQQPHDNTTTLPRPSSIPTHINRLDESESESSVVSEVTLMTYTDEKLTAVKKTFFQRLQHEQTKCGGQMTVEEKERLLREVQLEQEHKFQGHTIGLEDGVTDKKPYLLERWHALKHMQPSAATVEIQQIDNDDHGAQHQAQIDFMKKAMTTNNSSSTDEGMGQQTHERSLSSQGALHHRRRSSMDSTVTAKQGNRLGNNRTGINRRSSMDYSIGTAKRRGDMSRSSSEDEDDQGENQGTVDHNSPGSNSQDYLVRDDDGVMSPQEQYHEEDQTLEDQRSPAQRIFLQAAQEEVLNHTDLSSTPSLHEEQKGNLDHHDAGIAASPSTTSSTKNSDAIHELIELKMLIANQQATIDTLSSKLHNLELLANNNSTNNHHQVMLASSSSVQQSQQLRMQRLAAENEKLTSQLNECREREIQLQNEVIILSSPTKHEQVDVSNKEREDRQDDLERTNVSLTKENEELRRQLMDMKKLLGTRMKGTEDSDIVVTTAATAMAERRSSSIVTEITGDSTTFADSIANTL